MSQTLNGSSRSPAAPGAVPDGQSSLHGVLPSAGPAGSPASGAAAAATQDGTLDALRARRVELAERVAALTWDLGGLTYEMAIRDHYRLDVLARRAAELQEADAQLGEVERLLAGAESGVQGQCRSCGAVHSRGAAYCWRCGAALLSEARPSVLSAVSSDPASALTSADPASAVTSVDNRPVEPPDASP